MAAAQDESRYNDEELGWEKMSSADVLNWESAYSHNVPKPRTPASYDLVSKVVAREKYLRFTIATGYEVLFNFFQEPANTTRERPHVGNDTSMANQIWMAFYPTKVDYRGTLFLNAAISNVALQASIIESNPNRYRLSPSIATSWLGLEKKVHEIIRTLELHIDFPQPVRPPFYPSHYHYGDEYATKDAALEAARKSRNAFASIQAYLSFLVSFWHLPEARRSIDSLALWLSKLLRLDTTWTTVLLKFHPINYTERVTRLGMTISFDSPWMRYLPIFLDCNIPVGVYLGETTAVIHSDERWPEFCPYVRGTVQLHDDPSSCDCDVCKRRQQPSNPVVPEDPSRFREDREAEWLKHCEELEVSTEKMIRGKPIDEHGGWVFWLDGWSVYEWVDIAGCYQRCAVARSLSRAVFDAHRPTSRYFSPLHSEIDLCVDFARPTPAPPVVAPPSPPPAAEDSPVHPTPTYLYSEDEEDEYDEPRGSTAAATIPSTTLTSSLPKWKQVLESRLGFDCDVDASSLPQLHSTLAESIFAPTPKGLNKTLQALGLVPSSCQDTMSEADRLLCTFPLRVLSNKSLVIADLPTQFDIAARGVLQSLRCFQIQSVQQRDGDKIINRFAIGTTVKPLRFQHFVVVVDSVTLLEIARNGWTGILDITRQLVRRGIPFHTARYYPSSTSPTVRVVRREGLGVLTSATTSLESYRQYEQLRDTFLRTPRGALALKEGGFVARFARDVVDVRRAAQRPSDDAANHGRVVGRVREGRVLIADYIEHAEMDLLLGRFLHYESAESQTGVTFWPTMAAWDTMGVNTSAWNDSAEEWYQRRLTSYTSGSDIKPFGSKAWRVHGKGLGKTRDIWKRYRKLADEFLKREYP